MINMHYKKPIFFLFLIIFSISFSYAADELYLDYNNYCAGFEVTFTLWNKTQWDDRKNIDEEDIDYFEDVDVAVYDGPLESLGALYDGETNNISEFKVSFSREDQYLVIIEGADVPGNFSTYEEYIYIQECKYAGDTDVPIEEDKTYNDVVYDFYSGDLELSLTQTNTSKEEITISQLSQGDVAVNERLENVETIYEIDFPQDIEFSEFSITFSNSEGELFSLYKYNSEDLSWEIVEEEISLPFEYLSAQEGTYALTNVEEEINQESNEGVTSQNNQESNESQSSSQEPIPVVQNSSSSKLPYFIIIGIIILGVIASPFLFKSKKRDDKEHFHEGTLSTYKQEYDKTKQYVLQYKDHYNKEAIKQALIQGNVPIDIIDKVFSEVYHL